MKTLIVALIACFLVLSCKTENMQITGANSPDRVFSSVTPSAKIKNTIVLNYDDQIVTAIRSQSDTIEDEERQNALFINTKNVSIQDGLVQSTGEGENKIWFIPFFVGAEPVEINTRQCLRYICACGGFPGQNASGCCAANDQISYIECVQTNCDQPACQSTCLGYAVYVACTTQEAIEWYSGGVIVEAEKVEVIDPTWYRPGPPPIQLTVDPNQEVNLSLKDYNAKQN